MWFLARVGSPHVHRKVRVDLETLSARLASEGPLASVQPDVPDQVAAVGKGLPTCLAKVGLLSRVHPAVPPQVGTVGEILPARFAGEEALARVQPLVPDEAVAVGQCFATGLAEVRSVPRVHLAVAQQVGVVGETFAARLAHVRLLASVGSPHVDGGGAAVAEGFAAELAVEGLLPRVCSDVPRQAGVLDEAFSACAAGVGLLAGVDPHMYL